MVKELRSCGPSCAAWRFFTLCTKEEFAHYFKTAVVIMATPSNVDSLIFISQVDWKKRPKEHWCRKCKSIFRCPTPWKDCQETCFQRYITRIERKVGPDVPLFQKVYTALGAVCSKCK